jgi:hypothetical protein
MSQLVRLYYAPMNIERKQHGIEYLPDHAVVTIEHMASSSEVRGNPTFQRGKSYSISLPIMLWRMRCSRLLIDFIDFCHTDDKTLYEAVFHGYAR